MRIIIAILIGIEIVRRIAETVLCAIALRYDPTFVILNPSADIVGECIGRHLLFPFGF